MEISPFVNSKNHSQETIAGTNKYDNLYHHLYLILFAIVVGKLAVPKRIKCKHFDQKLFSKMKFSNNDEIRRNKYSTIRDINSAKFTEESGASYYSEFSTTLARNNTDFLALSD